MYTYVYIYVDIYIYTYMYYIKQYDFVEFKGTFMSRRYGISC